MDVSKNLIVKGLFWNGVQLLVNQSFSFLIRLVLAKLLFPEQFGVVGMSAVIIGFIQVINDIGIGATLIQRKDEDLRPGHFHTAFWTGVVWSIILYLLVCLLVGPVAVDFYHEPILERLIPVLGLGIISSPVNLVHKAQLTKLMNFKKMAFIDNTSNIISGSISLALAFAGAGVWALAFNSVATIVIAMPLYFSATKWTPKYVWDRDAFVDIFGFGIYTTGTNIVNYIINNVDYLLIGKLLSTSVLGAYSFAFVLTETFKSRLVSVINNVMYPFYGKKQSDPASAFKYYLKVVEYNCIIVYPAMLLLFCQGKELILQFFGAKWGESIVPMQILSLAVMVQMMVNSNTAFIRGMGRPDFEFRLQVVKSIIYVPMLIGGISYGGIIGASYAVLINRILAILITHYAFKYKMKIEITAAEFLGAIKSPWIATIAAYFMSIICKELLHVNAIISAVALLLTYFFVVFRLKNKEFMQYLREYRLNRSVIQN